MFPSNLSELVPWILFLIPGWIAIVIAGAISDIGPSNEIYIIFSSFLISALSYALASWSYGFLTAPHPTGEHATGSAGTSSPTAVSKPPVLLVYVVAMIFGLALGISLESNALYKGLRLLPLGLGGAKVGEGRPIGMVLKEAKDNVLSYWIGGQEIPPARKHGDGNNEQNYFRVTFDSGPAYEGYIQIFELGETESNIYLNPACVVDGATVTPVKGPGVLIYERTIRTIQIVDRANSQCYALTVHQP